MNRARTCHLAALCVATLALAGPAAAQQGLTFPTPAEVAKQTTGPTLLPGSCREPEYPLTSIRRKESGRSTIRIYVDEKGAVTDTAVVGSSGFYLLDEEAAYAFRSCRFVPARDAAGAAIKSTIPKGYDWRLEKAPPDPWALLSLRQGAGFAAVADFAAVPFSGASAADPAQRAKMLQAANREATEKAQCPSIERASARIVPGGEKSDRRSLELWTLTQCGQDVRYVVAMFFPADQRASFRMMPLASTQPGP